MAILKDVELWFIKCDPKRPNAAFNKDQPTWEVQIRTKKKAQMNDWKALKLNPKAEVDENDKPYWKVNLKKKSKKKDGTDVLPVKVVNGHLEDVDPNTIGNGSIGDVRIFQYDYDVKGKKGVASMLMAIQLTKHIVYVPTKREDDFGMQETEVIGVAETMGDGESDNDDDAPY